MSNISKAFEEGKAFIPFITCGDPDLETTEKLVYAMERSGADIIELGIPFSDPTAEAPIIQEANIRALKNNITTDDVFHMVRRLRKVVKVPMVFMTYANVVFSYGAETFIRTCKEIGMDGLMLPDIPYEEKEEFGEICKKYDIDLISMIAPTSNSRIKMIAKNSEGFMHCVSSSGETTGEEIAANVEKMTELVKSAKDVPCVVGTGITSPQQAKEMAKYADGVIVGSAIIKICEKYGRDCVSYIEQYVKEMKDAIQAA